MDGVILVFGTMGTANELIKGKQENTMSNFISGLILLLTLIMVVITSVSITLGGCELIYWVFTGDWFHIFPTEGLEVTETVW